MFENRLVSATLSLAFFTAPILGANAEPPPPTEPQTHSSVSVEEKSSDGPPDPQAFSEKRLVAALDGLIASGIGGPSAADHERVAQAIVDLANGRGMSTRIIPAADAPTVLAHLALTLPSIHDARFFAAAIDTSQLSPEILHALEALTKSPFDFQLGATAVVSLPMKLERSADGRPRRVPTGAKPELQVSGFLENCSDEPQTLHLVVSFRAPGATVKCELEPRFVECAPHKTVTLSLLIPENMKPGSEVEILTTAEGLQNEITRTARYKLDKDGRRFLELAPVPGGGLLHPAVRALRADFQDLTASHER